MALVAGLGVVLAMPSTAWAQAAPVYLGEARSIDGCYRDEMGNLHCGPVGADPGPPGQYDRIEHLADYFAWADEDLALTSGSYVGHGRGTRPATVTRVTQKSRQVSYLDAALQVSEGGSLVATGTVTAVFESWGSSVDAVVQLTEGSVTRTLELTVSVTPGGLGVCGTLTTTAGDPPVSGGWLYSPAEGVWEDPASEAGFHDAVEAMLHCQLLDRQDDPRGLSLGNTFILIGNIIGQVVTAILDAMIIYTPPIAYKCDGPLAMDGPGQSCEGSTPPCLDNLSSVYEKIDEIPNVTLAFKKCMKGRLGCGGSHFRRTRIDCADPHTCGPCGALHPAGGCSLGGSPMWFCTVGTQCDCANTVFHEIAHSCGALDQTGDSHRIGNFFEDEFHVANPSIPCIPVD